MPIISTKFFGLEHSYLLKLAKFLVPILKPLTSDEFTVKDFFYFAEEVIYQELGFFMSSLDVHLLFTNIPLEDTIEICPNKLFKAFALATENLYFIFDRTFR